MIKLTLPIYGVIQKTKNNRNCAITFNWAMSANPWTYSKAKKRFKQMIMPQLLTLDPIEGKIKISYKYYAKRNGTDNDNFCSVVKKFCQDALVETGLIDDDNCEFIVKSSEEYIEVDRDNPRVEAFIYSSGGD